MIMAGDKYDPNYHTRLQQSPKHNTRGHSAPRGIALQGFATPYSKFVFVSSLSLPLTPTSTPRIITTRDSQCTRSNTISYCGLTPVNSAGSCAICMAWLGSTGLHVCGKRLEWCRDNGVSKVIDIRPHPSEFAWDLNNSSDR